MSEEVKKKQKETENEEVILDHFYHDHPLTLKEFDREYNRCYGCWRFILQGETAYMCSHGCRYPILHEECAEMPREIRLPMHPQHTLIQTESEHSYPKCVVCNSLIIRIGYYCKTPDSCEFSIHVGCALNKSQLEKSCIDHPSHDHQLTLMRWPGRSCSSRCDACGTIEKGNSFTCIECRYWINESCATLPDTQNHPRLHHHPLSLVYQVPLQLLKLCKVCAICSKGILPLYWVYHCEICRYAVHIKCLINSSSTTTTMNIDANVVEDKDVIVSPVLVNKVAEQLIEPFVIKVGGKAILGDGDCVNGKCKFHNHEHELSLISRDDQEEEEEENSDGDEFLPQLSRRRSEIVCDGCCTPIFQKKYLSCGECKFFLHQPCFHLPPSLPSHPIHERCPRWCHHSLILKTTPKFEMKLCAICDTYTNGLFYGCTDIWCDFRLDIKCASLPDTIKHLSHPHHHLKLSPESRRYLWGVFCVACGMLVDGACYECSICKIFLHASCASLPAAVSNPTLDSHPLPLTFDATPDHPSDFYCEICEQEMKPNIWMYHCRSCDFSIHPHCFPTQSGKYRNMKFGKRYVNPTVHHHPLVYQFLTKKLHCDICKGKKYGQLGFQCASDKCEFFMCSYPCSRKDRDELKEVD